MEWTDEVIGELRAFWAEGLSTAEIGRRLGVTKNAIVGKAHRLDLPARPSPIRREPGAEPLQRIAVRRLEGPTLPPLPSASVEGAGSGFAVPEAEARVPSLESRPAPVAVAPPVAPVAPRPVPSVPIRSAVSVSRPVHVPPPRPAQSMPRTYGRVVTCCWPIGEPGTHGFHFCDVPSEPGRPYCEEHVKVAYVKVRDRREDAA